MGTVGEGAAAGVWARCLFAIGSVLGALAVAAGAIGAHALQDQFVERGAVWWSLAERYHAVHALATLAAAWACERFGHAHRQGGAAATSSERRPTGGNLSLGARAAGVCFVLGIVLFSGGLYLRALGIDVFLIHLVPVGGSVWLVGWLCLAASPWR